MYTDRLTETDKRAISDLIGRRYSEDRKVSTSAAIQVAKTLLVGRDIFPKKVESFAIQELKRR